MKKTATLGAASCLLSPVAACSLLDDDEMLVCSLADLEQQEMVSLKFNRKRILARKLDGEIVIFSLVCSHKKCTVKFNEFDEQFACPCHEGLYDKYGEVLDGPPPEPLTRFKHEVRGEELWVLNQIEK